MENKLPKGWVEIELSLISTKVESVNPVDVYKSSFQYIDISSIDSELLEIKEPKTIDVEKAPSRARQLILKSDILFSTVRPNLRRIARVPENLSSQISSTGFCVIRPSVKCNENFIFYFLISDTLVNKVLLLARGASYPAIRNSDLLKQLIPLPPRAEQDRIVAKVDALMAQHAAIQQAMERIPPLLKDFRQQVLTQAVTGKLTEEWRVGKELGDLSELLVKIDQRRNNHKSKKVREISQEVRADLDLYEVPELWKWLSLEYLMNEEEKFRYGVVQPGNNVDEQKLIRVKDIINEEVDVNSLRGISWEINDKYKSAQVKEGDILVSIVGTIGRTIIIDNKSEGLSIARALAKIPVIDFSSKYIKIFFDCSIGQTWLVGDTREVARKTLNLEQLKTLPVPIPPIREQQEIVRRVESLFEKATAIEQRYAQLKEQIDTLPQSILHKAFKGELVEQLASDGSAVELLEEIEKLKLNSNLKGKIKSKSKSK